MVELDAVTGVVFGVELITLVILVGGIVSVVESDDGNSCIVSGVVVRGKIFVTLNPGIVRIEFFDVTDGVVACEKCCCKLFCVRDGLVKALVEVIQ